MKEVSEIKSGNIIGMAKSLTLKKGEDFYKVSIWVQKEVNEKDVEKVLKEIEEVIDRKLEESLNKEEKKKVIEETIIETENIW